MKVKASNAQDLLVKLQNESIKTWFDLGLFLDRIQQHRNPSPLKYKKSYKEFIRKLGNKSLGFLTFQYSVDGVSIEIAKYSKVFKQMMPEMNQCFISGDFREDSIKIVPSYADICPLENCKGFADWPLYKLFFFEDLERGSKNYNQLITELWDETLSIVNQLACLVEDKNLGLLYLVNVASNPGNVSLALATVLVSEYLHIPVINNSHDFYYEGGHSKRERKAKHIGSGPRDFFFRNSHLGEFFSIITMLYPWNSPLWVQVVINQTQRNLLISKYGHNPARVTDIGTAIDTDQYQLTSKRKKINTFYQFERILSRYNDVLISYSVQDVLKNGLVDENNPKPILISLRKTKPIYYFLNENIVFLQPTRIISRKQIEVGFEFIKKFLSQTMLQEQFGSNDNLKLTLLVTGPIATGHFDYFETLLEKFQLLLNELHERIRQKVFLAFLFSELDKDEYHKHFNNPVGIPDLYNISSLVMLPSKTEGRGLPIIEAATSGVPIFCNRYAPLAVFEEVIGKHLSEHMQLKVHEYNGRIISQQEVEAISNRIMFPHLYIKEQIHNKKVIEKRYSLKALRQDLDKILRLMYYQALPSKKMKRVAKKVWEQYPQYYLDEKELSMIMNVAHKKYMPGIAPLRFMSMLKSLIDPSSFREELQFQYAYLYSMAEQMVSASTIDLELQKKIAFFKTIEALLNYHKGQLSVLHDHSFPYRFRNRRYYPYQDYTLQELTGVINYLYVKGFDCKQMPMDTLNAHFYTDWKLAMLQLTGSYHLAIDDRELFSKKLQANVPIAYFSGKFLQNELELIVLQSIRSRLELSIDKELTEELLNKTTQHLAPIYVFVSRHECNCIYSYLQVLEIIQNNSEPELQLIYNKGLLKVVETEQYCVGIHFRQIGRSALSALAKVKQDKGVLITTRSQAVVMTDFLGMDRIHIGKADTDDLAAYMGIEREEGFVQFVPAHVRDTLFYPTPLQTSKDLFALLKSEAYNNNVVTHGHDVIDELIEKEEAKSFVPLKDVLTQLSRNKNVHNPYHWEYVSGLYSDGNAWNGAVLKVTGKSLRTEMQMDLIFDPAHPRSVLEFREYYNQTNQAQVVAGWNGGYILNAELVGKLGLPEVYIGSPLGLLIENFEIKSPPLFNKPALLIHDDGNLSIERVNCTDGFSVSRGTSRIFFDADDRNRLNEDQLRAFFDLQADNAPVNCNEKVVLRLAGDKVIEVIEHPDGPVTLLPVGLTLVIAPDDYERLSVNVGDTLTFSFTQFDKIQHAVEAGPLLVKNGKVAIDMETEGWLTESSISTQAARLDYLDMRGPKIAAGITKDGDLLVLTVNGRIRESVGATHEDMANLLLQYDVVVGLGFDPGGSSTLVVDDKQVNISPYNSGYLTSPFTLPPEPRFVSSALFVVKKP